MDRSNVISLIKEIKTQDSIGQFISSETKRNVYCNVSSISGSEFFSAGENGIKADLRFTLFRYEYEGEQIVEFEGRRYGVYRTFKNRSETIELYCELKNGVTNG